MPAFKNLRGAQAAVACLGLTLFAGSQARADIVHADDVIIQGSLCVGIDCINNENFGFDTIRLKENNLRIMFVDTSNTASFPARDWQLVANDSANGGLNYFGIHDCGTTDVGGSSACGTRVFVVEGGARANAIYVRDNKVGFGTAAPVLELHIRDGDTPSIRLEQDGSSGFTPQTWDISGNEANFFIRDVTNGSRLPIRTRPGAPTSSLDIASTGFVGLGNAAPQDPLHITATANPIIRFESSGASANKTTWSTGAVLNTGLYFIKDVTNNTFPLRIRAGAPTDALELRANGAVRFSGLLNCTGLTTDANGIVGCTTATPRSKVPDQLASAGTPVSVFRSSASASLGGQQAAAGTPGSSASAPPDSAAADTCSAGDMAGSWSLVGTGIESFGANSVLWCDDELTQNRTALNRYNIAGNCRSHAPNDPTPEMLTIVGNGSITETEACRIGGSFKVKQGSVVVATASIVEGRIEGPASKKTRAVGVSRSTRGRANILQTIVLQR